MSPSLDDAMRTYARFLNASWEVAWTTATTMEHVDPAEFMADWAQANWELLVETPFREFAGFGNAYLEPYGEGADCNDASSRVWLPQALATHRVVCRARGGTAVKDLLTGRDVDATEEPIVFDHFATTSDSGWHQPSPPFDCVHGHQGEQELLVRIDEVSFVVEPIAESHT